MNVQIEESWKIRLEPEFEKDYFRTLTNFVREEYSQYPIYPPGKLIFNAFNLCPFDKVKVVILGQDPYHGPKQAQGLSFSVPDDLPAPPSLQNILKELEDDIGHRVHHDLTTWAEQGVLLLNACLTVPAGNANGHAGLIWEPFTDAIIRLVNDLDRPVVFILWGGYARKKKTLITNGQHLVIESAHPSPLSSYRGFFGSRPFSKTNAFLTKNQEAPTDWLK